MQTLGVLQFEVFKVQFTAAPAGGAESEVGLVHNFMRFEQFKGNLLSRFSPLTYIMTKVCTPLCSTVAAYVQGGLARGFGMKSWLCNQ